MIRICLLALSLPLLALSTSSAHTADETTVGTLRTEYKENPMGIDARQPRLSWQILSTRRGVAQSAYQVKVALTEADLRAGRNLLWDSGRIASSESIHVTYSGTALKSQERCFWQVRIWDEAGNASAWSDPASWEMGLLDPADWTASWIEPAIQQDATRSQPAPLLRRTFTVNGPIRSARALCHEPRPLRASPEWSTRRRSSLHAWLDELQQAASVPNLRRNQFA